MWSTGYHDTKGFWNAYRQRYVKLLRNRPFSPQIIRENLWLALKPQISQITRIFLRRFLCHLFLFSQLFHTHLNKLHYLFYFFNFLCWQIILILQTKGTVCILISDWNTNTYSTPNIEKMRLCGMNVRYHVGKCLWHISNALTHCLLIATKAYQKNRPFGM